MYPMTIKVECKYLPGPPGGEPLESSDVPSWTVHPSLKTAVDSLEAYHRWVSYVVMPIAFQWIEEHSDAVYKDMRDDLKDDIGVVISAAFQLVRQTPCYKDGQERWKHFAAQLDKAPLEHRPTNPIWREIADRIQREISEAFREHKRVLDDTIET